MINRLLTSQNPKINKIDHHTYLGEIININSKNNTMNIRLYDFDNLIFEDVQIMSALSSSGASVRFIPSIGTRVLVHSDTTTKSGLIHLGYFTEGIDTITQNKNDLSTVNTSLLRNLNPDEFSVSNATGSEIFIGDRGDILLKGAQGSQVYIDNTELKLLAQDLIANFNDSEINVGRVKRTIRETPDTVLTDTNKKIIRDSTGINNDDYETHRKPHKEFRVSIGNNYNSDGTPNILESEVLGYKLTPTVGAIILASKIYDEYGQEERPLIGVEKYLQYMVKTGQGFKMSVDEDGTFYIVNEITQSYIKFKNGYSFDNNDNKIDGTEFEIKIANSIFTINKDGELTFTNTNVDDTDKKTSITTTKVGNIEVKRTSDGNNYDSITIDDNGIKVKSVGDVITENDNGVMTLKSNGQLDVNGNFTVDA